MKEVRYFYVPEAVSSSELPEEEAVHAVRVLRLTAGDEMVLMDGQGSFYRAQVTHATQKRCLYKIVETLPQESQWLGHIHLAIAPTKMMERMEWLVEKSTEVGVDEITFLNCQFSERRSVKLPRIEKIAVSAMKQSRKCFLPKLHDMTPFDEFVARQTTGNRFIAHCYEEVPRSNLFNELQRHCADDETLVMIGPEGDFSIEEVRKAVDLGFVSVDLGKSRLRTETAGLAALMSIQLSKQLLVK